MCQVTGTGARRPCRVTCHVSRVTGFTLIEMLVTLTLLSLIVLALMSVFNATQAAFRSGLTETDILESGRMTMSLMADDLAKTTPSFGFCSTNFLGVSRSLQFTNGPVNFYVTANPYTRVNQPFIQSLPGTSLQRSNVLQSFFMLSRQNVGGRPSWVGTGYAVDPLSWPTNSLYRFVAVTNMTKGNPLMLFTNFYYAANVYGFGQSRESSPFTNATIWTHVMDGVVHLAVRPYDPNGLEMTNNIELRYNGSTNTFTNLNTIFFTPSSWPIASAAPLKVYGCYMFSNSVPASVEVNLGVLEDAVLQRVEGLPTPLAQTNYLFNHVGQVHLFRERVWIRNLDPTAYQTQ